MHCTTRIGSINKKHQNFQVADIYCTVGPKSFDFSFYQQFGFLYFGKLRLKRLFFLQQKIKDIMYNVHTPWAIACTDADMQVYVHLSFVMLEKIGSRAQYSSIYIGLFKSQKSIFIQPQFSAMYSIAYCLVSLEMLLYAILYMRWICNNCRRLA